jgi:hypothetical protein
MLLRAASRAAKAGTRRAWSRAAAAAFHRVYSSPPNFRFGITRLGAHVSVTDARHKPLLLAQQNALIGWTILRLTSLFALMFRRS